MAKVFEPYRSIYVLASQPHPIGTEYRVAWGYENWGEPVPVTKIQMTYNGRVAGMLSPSYPDGTFDRKGVHVALELVDQGEGGTSKSKQVLVLKEVSAAGHGEHHVNAIEDEIINIHLSMFQKRNRVTPVIQVDFKRSITIEENLVAFLFRVDIH